MDISSWRLSIHCRKNIEPTMEIWKLQALTWYSSKDVPFRSTSRYLLPKNGKITPTTEPGVWFHKNYSRSDEGTSNKDTYVSNVIKSRRYIKCCITKSPLDKYKCQKFCSWVKPPEVTLRSWEWLCFLRWSTKLLFTSF